MKSLIHLVWAPEDQGAGKWMSEPSQRLASESLAASERAMSADKPESSQSDTFFDDEAERQYEREQSMPPGGNLGGDIDHWRP